MANGAQTWTLLTRSTDTWMRFKHYLCKHLEKVSIERLSKDRRLLWFMLHHFVLDFQQSVSGPTLILVFVTNTASLLINFTEDKANSIPVVPPKAAVQTLLNCIWLFLMYRCTWILMGKHMIRWRTELHKAYHTCFLCACAWLYEMKTSGPCIWCACIDFHLAMFTAVQAHKHNTGF